MNSLTWSLDPDRTQTWTELPHSNDLVECGASSQTMQTRSVDTSAFSGIDPGNFPEADLLVRIVESFFRAQLPGWPLSCQYAIDGRVSPPRHTVRELRTLPWLPVKDSSIVAAWRPPILAFTQLNIRYTSFTWAPLMFRPDGSTT